MCICMCINTSENNMDIACNNSKCYDIYIGIYGEIMSCIVLPNSVGVGSSGSVLGMLASWSIWILLRWYVVMSHICTFIYPCTYVCKFIRLHIYIFFGGGGLLECLDLIQMVYSGYAYLYIHIYKRYVQSYIYLCIFIYDYVYFIHMTSGDVGLLECIDLIQVVNIHYISTFMHIFLVV
jgi:hypothetical protein